MKEVILVTGGLGFIGRKLVEKLNIEFPQYKIVILDQYIRDADNYIRSDINDFGELYLSVKNIQGDIKYIIHAASEVGRVNGEEHPWKMVDSSIKGTLNLIHIALEFNAKFIYFSTSEVYGDAFDEKEVSEEDIMKISPLMLNNIYSLSKLFGESLVRHYVKNYGLMGIGIRPFMVYGPGVMPSKYKSALDIFIWNLINKKEVTVHENCIRSWCYLDDFVDALIIIVKNHTFELKKYESYNVGNNKEYKTIEELAYLIADELNADKNLIKVEKFDGLFKSQSKYFNSDKLTNLGFEPKVNITDGIKNMIEWYKKMKQEEEKK